METASQLALDRDDPPTHSDLRAMRSTVDTSLRSPPSRDRKTAVITLIVFFTLISSTLELYWLCFHDGIEQRHDLFALLWSWYWPADRTFRVGGYSVAKSFTIGLEGINTLITPVLNGWLIVSLLRKRWYANLLQLIVATYSVYGTLLYYLVAHLSGYENAASRTLYPILLLYLSNAPWLLGYAYMGHDALRSIRASIEHNASRSSSTKKVFHALVQHEKELAEAEKDGLAPARALRPFPRRG